MSVARGWEDGPKILLERSEESYLDLLSDAAVDDDDFNFWKWGAALQLHAMGWSMEQIGMAVGRDKGNVSRQINKLKIRMQDRFVA